MYKSGSALYNTLAKRVRHYHWFLATLWRETGKQNDIARVATGSINDKATSAALNTTED